MEELRLASQELDLRMVRGDYGQDSEGGNHAVEPLRLCLLRFLRGNDFSVTKAFSQVGWFQVSSPLFSGLFGFLFIFPHPRHPFYHYRCAYSYSYYRNEPFLKSAWVAPKIAGAVLTTANLSIPLCDRAHVCTTKLLGG